jgi:hypothetical protein
MGLFRVDAGKEKGGGKEVIRKVYNYFICMIGFVGSYL